MDRSINRSIDQSINPSIDQSIKLTNSCQRMQFT